MHQFLRADRTAWKELERKVRGRCLRFADQELPPGASPKRGQVGLEVDSDSGRAVLYVERGVSYSDPGNDHLSIQQWLRSGRLDFSSFEELSQWVGRELATTYEAPPASRDWPTGVVTDWPCRTDFPPLIGRDEELAEAETVLGQTLERSAVVFVGRSGVGKSAIARELAWRWCERDTQHIAARVEPSRLLAGATCPADRSERLTKAFDALTHLGDKALVIIDSLDAMCGWPAARPTDSFAPKQPRYRLRPDHWSLVTLRAAIDDGLKLCATLPPRGLTLLGDPELRRRLKVITLHTPTERHLHEELLPTAGRWFEQVHGVAIPEPTLRFALRHPTMTERCQPAAVLRLIEHAVLRAKSRGQKTLCPDDLG